MKYRWQPLSAVVTVVILSLAWWMLLARTGERQSRIATESAGLTIEKVKTLSALTTLKVEVADALVTELRGKTGAIRAVVIARGDLTLGVDLSEARFESVDSDAKHAVLILPQPRIQTLRLDHEKTRLLGVYTSGLWLITPGGDVADIAAINAAFRDAQRAIASAADNPDLVVRTRGQAERVLRTFFEAMGWEADFRWAD